MDSVYPNLRLGAEFIKTLDGRWPVRIFLSDEGKTHYRCHIALPEELFVLDRYVWPNRFQIWWKRDDGFYLFDTLITRPNNRLVDQEDINVALRALLLKIMRNVVRQTALN